MTTNPNPPPKYPSTPYWPWSPTIGRSNAVHEAPERFVGEDVVATEKLDGGNTLLHQGLVYARSVAAPSEGKWMAMVKKHHAWKVTEPDVYLYGEDIYGQHSIAYDPVEETATFTPSRCGTATVRSPPLRSLKPTRGSGRFPWCRCCIGAASNRLPSSASS